MKELFKQLDKYIDNHDDIVIMTHARCDLDGMSSAICLYEIILSKGKNVCIVKPCEKFNRSMKKGFKLLESNNVQVCFKDENEILDGSNKLLIIVDTQKRELVESTKVLDGISDKIIIDHHISGDDYIDDVLYKYNDMNKSSVVEIMCEYLIYLKFMVQPLVLTLMLGGMVTDTSSFSLKTTYKTFEMAAFLAKNGANFGDVQNLFKEPKEELIKRYEFINNSMAISKNVLMCKMDDKVHSNVDIALLAKELLKFENIEVSFAIGHLSKKIIGVSARSGGNVNVGKVMEKLGGGGHFTDAACQFKDKSIDEVALMVEKAFKEA